MSFKVIRTHEICAGHRVVGHESKCRHLHGHNYKFHFVVEPIQNALDKVGRVVDFSVVKSTLCEWLEDNWDHKFLHWEKDELITGLAILVKQQNQFGNDIVFAEDAKHFSSSLVSLPFNPTAENLAQYMVDVIGPTLLGPHGVQLTECRIEETSKCHVEYTI